MSVINRNPVVETKGPADHGAQRIPAVEAGDASSTEVIGRIHSVETCGTVDGPGIRFIVFMRGCLMRCKYCHNRDTWDTQGGREVTVPELMKDLTSYRHFMNASGGGVTASGGEAMLQQEFIAELFAACKLIASEFLCETADRLVQVLGSRGYDEENLAPQLLRDARVTRIFEGTSEALFAFLGAAVLAPTSELWSFLRADLDAARVADELAEGVNLTKPALARGPVAEQVNAVWSAVKAKNQYYHDRVFRGVVLAQVSIPDFLDVKLEPAEIEAKRQSAMSERMAKLPELDAAIRQALAPRSHRVEVVPAK